MVTTRGRALAAEARAAPEAREGDVDQGQKTRKTTGQRANRSKNNNVPPSTPPSSGGKGKEKPMSWQLSTRLGRGKLQDIMNLPIEIFAKICYYLDPLDLRHLALTNKRVWDFLMTKEAKHIWKETLSSVKDLPECPTDLNEPQYVCLMYSSECHTLGCQSRGTQVDWFYRVRFCKACFDVKMTNESGASEASQSVRYRSWFPGLLEYLDGSEIYDLGYYSYSESGKHFYIDGVNNVVETYKTLLKGSDAEQRIEEYKKQLSDQSRYRASTGAAMLKWHLFNVGIEATVNLHARQGVLNPDKGPRRRTCYPMSLLSSPPPPPPPLPTESDVCCLDFSSIAPLKSAIRKTLDEGHYYHTN
ncbi:hypothetical protein FRC05_001089 [Tulasnella sp. 425]|nr:hypothetical protein FRC05_001089 [Tulasnella sp. 425]